jgi:hypothetical protein
MKLKATIIIFVVVVASTFMLLCYGLFTRYNYLTAQWDKEQGNVRLLVYGERRMDDRQQFEVARQMGFQMQTIAGCIIPKSEANGADAYNAVMTTALKKKLGKQWRAKFDTHVDSLFRLQSGDRIYQAVKNKTNVRELIRKCDSAKRGSVFVKVVNPADTNPTHPNAWVCHEINKKFEVIAYYRVNPYTLGISEIHY